MSQSTPRSGETDPPPDHPVDRAALRVLAHPLRSRMLTELRALGRATSAELARILDTNTGVTSYHLRALADVGLIAEHPESTGRRRYWMPATDERPIDIDESDPDDEASAEWLARDYAAHFGTKVQDWISTSTVWPTTWQELCGLDDHLVIVTDSQLTSLQNEMTALLEKYRRVGAGNPSAKRVTYYTCALPVDAPPRW